ncbi:succinylglutamate desuccinylase [filamentous cyanobacterium CCP1]|nr:succinylglutamate desuccinylase [filamentous cyanobacterium CCP2]PSB66066.1 succinylglutamate desuccinylase [filamentous cyanobacterium CCP1]
MTPEIFTVPFMQLASGDRLSVQVYQYVGATAGKKAYLQANLHGAEIAGNAVILQFIEWLNTLDATQLIGEIWLVPVCNPIGTNQRSHYFSSGRYNHYDGKDWNRIFWDYEKAEEDLMAFAKSHLKSDRSTIQHQFRQQIQERFSGLLEQLNAPSGVPVSELYRYHLQSLCLDADYLIDLHTSAGQGLDYVYYFRDREASAAWFGLPIGILLDVYDGDAFDEAFIKPWLALETCFAELGRELRFDIEAWTLELGTAMQCNPQSVENGLLGVKNYLARKGMLATPEPPLPLQEMKLTTRSTIKRYYAPAGGMIQFKIALGSTVEAGQQLYQILSFNKEGRLPQRTDVQAEQAGLVFDLSINQAVNQGEYVLGLL